MRMGWVGLLVVAVGVAGCKGSPSNRAQEQLEALQRKKEAEAKAKAAAEEARLKAATAPAADASLEPPYDEAGSTRLRMDGPCPEGLWALFPGDPPGGSKEEKKANAAKKKELAAALKGKQFMVRLRPPDVKLLPYDAPKGEFTIELLGAIDCSDSIGHVTMAWTDAKAVDPGASAAKEGAEVTQNIWDAPKVTYTLPMKSQAEAKAFEAKHRMNLAARVVFTLGEVKVDKKLKKIAAVSEAAAGESLGYGGGVEDWGAGRMVKAKPLGVRVATDGEKTVLFDKR